MLMRFIGLIIAIKNIIVRLVNFIIYLFKGKSK